MCHLLTHVIPESHRLFNHLGVERNNFLTRSIGELALCVGLVRGKEVVAGFRQQEPEQLEALDFLTILLSDIVSGEKAVAILEVVGEENAVHAPKCWVSNQCRAQTALATQDLSSVGDGMSSCLQRDCHLTQSAI